MKLYENFLSIVTAKKDKKQNKTHNDSFVNTFANIGVNDKPSMTGLQYTNDLKSYQLAELYQNNGVAKRIVDCVVDDATRDFIKTDPIIIDELKRLKARQHISDACKKARLFGNSLLVAIVDDRQTLDTPLNLLKINKIASFVVFDSRKFIVNVDDIDNDVFSATYSKPKYFSIYTSTGSMLRVHASRCHLFSGDTAVRMTSANKALHGISVLQVCYNALKNYDILQLSTVNIVTDFVQVILKMNDLDMKMSHEGMQGQIQNRLTLLDQSRSVANTILIDAQGEDYEKKSSNISGLSDVFDKYIEVICAATGIPATKLFGKSPSGFNATGLSDIKNWYDVVSAYRSDDIEPVLDWIFEIFKHQKAWATKPDEEQFRWSFSSLITPSDVEIADLKLKTAQMQSIYMDRGGLDPREAWQKTNGTGTFIPDIITEEVEEDSELPEDIEEEDVVDEELDIEETNALKTQDKSDLVFDKLLEKLG